MTSLDSHWQAKLAAWTHDPAEKALILLRTPEGHEGGTVRDIQRELFDGAVPAAISEIVKRADHWASAADRPQFPQQEGNRYASWAQVRFHEHPVLIHPLSAERYELEKFNDIEPSRIRELSTNHFRSLIVRRDDGTIDHRLTALAFWRFGPSLRDKDIGKLWSVLPADTRVPDHSIWNHLDLTGAFAGAFASDRDANPSLLSISFGPVQDFIAAARSTSDLWAGSHLLARIAWEGMSVICEQFGPDALIFPQLRGVPLVDLWLQGQGVPTSLFPADAEWRRGQTDANPLFAAALPNKLVAIVPADAAKELAGEVTNRVRKFVQSEARACLTMLLDGAGIANTDDLYCHTQLNEQLAGFPEVHWAVVPFSPLIRGDRESIDTSELQAAQAPFLGTHGGFLGSQTWKLLSRDITVDGGFFYRPNPGVLYPSLYELLDRTASAAKSIRPFSQRRQTGFRCTLTGESEWLTTDAEQLELSPGQRKDSLWTRNEGRFGIKKGEHLGALSMLKRLWPSRFTDCMRRALPELEGVRRYVVSTHTMALATSLERWIESGTPVPDIQLDEKSDPVALPRKLATQAWSLPEKKRNFLRKLPSHLDQLAESGEDGRYDKERRALQSAFDGAKPESYYALIQMDGDRMGAWISGSEGYTCRYGETWHPQISAAVRNRFQSLHDYLETQRPNSPARHGAISGALNNFSLHVARHVVEDLCKGKLIYAGGDDVLAMVSVDDLLAAMMLLRLGYSGVFPETDEAAGALRKLLGIERDQSLKLGRGHALLHGQLLQLMGSRASASMGAVIAHHQAPLGAVLRRLRSAESRAKSSGRDAFSIDVLKRGGGAIELTLPWKGEHPVWWKHVEDSPMGLLLMLRNAFAGSRLSRRAAYHVQSWIEELPRANGLSKDSYASLLEKSLAYQFERQGGERALGQNLARIVLALGADTRVASIASTIRDALGTAEFLAREGRTAHGEAA